MTGPERPSAPLSMVDQVRAMLELLEPARRIVIVRPDQADRVRAAVKRAGMADRLFVEESDLVPEGQAITLPVDPIWEPGSGVPPYPPPMVTPAFLRGSYPTAPDIPDTRDDPTRRPA